MVVQGGVQSATVAGTGRTVRHVLVAEAKEHDLEVQADATGSACEET